MTGAESAVGHSEVEGRQQELGEKRGRIHKLLEEQGLDAIVISRHENVAWRRQGWLMCVFPFCGRQVWEAC
jgi:hypothetical protein